MVIEIITEVDKMATQVELAAFRNIFKYREEISSMQTKLAYAKLEFRSGTENSDGEQIRDLIDQALYPLDEVEMLLNNVSK